MATKKLKEYGSEPFAPGSKKADTLPKGYAPVVKQEASLGNKDMPMIPHPPKFGKTPIGGPSHGFGHSGKQKQGAAIRLSGHAKAHFIGKK